MNLTIPQPPNPIPHHTLTINGYHEKIHIKNHTLTHNIIINHLKTKPQHHTNNQKQPHPNHQHHTNPPKNRKHTNNKNLRNRNPKPRHNNQRHQQLEQTTTPNPNTITHQLTQKRHPTETRHKPQNPPKDPEEN